MIDESTQWRDSLHMYRGWAKILNTSHYPDKVREMMQRHRNRFPNQSKIFDQIDREVSE